MTPSWCGKTSSAISSAEQDHFTAAREGTSEIGLAVLATTLSVVAVFIPVAYMKGIVGRFFFQFGITVAFAVLVSLFVSFTLDPMLSSRWVDPDIERRGKRHFLARILDGFNRWFDRTADGYRHGHRLGPRSPQDHALFSHGGLLSRGCGPSPCFKPSFSPITTRANFS